MSYEQRDNSGSLFNNDRKTNEKQPGWKGSAKIDGVDYWISAWVKPTKAGGKWISLAFERKDAQERAQGGVGQGGEKPSDFDQNLPF